MRTYRNNLKLFKENFGRQKNFLAHNNLKIEKYDDGHYLIGDLTYEESVCLWTARNENLKNEIVDYLTANDYNVTEFEH